MTATLRRATPADLDAIMAIETATFPEDAWSPETMAAELASPHAVYLMAEGGADTRRTAADPLGYAGLLAPTGSGQGDVQTIAVAESARRRGVGRALLTALIAEAGARGARELFLEVRADNPAAQALYLSEGFERIAERPGYYPGGVAAVVMRRTT